MSNEQTIAKIYRYIDGEMNQDEMVEFENYLSSHPGEASLFNQWKGVHDQIKKENYNLPDPDLKGGIMSRINTKRYSKREKSSVIVSFFSWLGSFWHEESLRFGYTFIGGILAGILILSVLNTTNDANSVNSADAKGTFYNTLNIKELKMADILHYETPEVKAICSVKYSPAVVEIILNLSSIHQVNSHIEFDLSSFKVLTIQNAGVNEQSVAAFGSNFVRINNTGNNKYLILLENKNSAPNEIALKIVRSDTILFHNSALINKK